MNIQNLGSQESVGVKYIEGICVEFCLRSDLEKTHILVILLSRDGFKWDPETKFQTSTS